MTRPFCFSNSFSHKPCHSVKASALVGQHSASKGPQRASNKHCMVSEIGGRTPQSWTSILCKAKKHMNTPNYRSFANLKGEKKNKLTSSTAPFTKKRERYIVRNIPQDCTQILFSTPHNHRDATVASPTHSHSLSLSPSIHGEVFVRPLPQASRVVIQSLIICSQHHFLSKEKSY